MPTKTDEVLLKLRAHRQPEDYPVQINWEEAGYILAEIDSLRAQEKASMRERDQARTDATDAAVARLSVDEMTEVLIRWRKEFNLKKE